MIKNMWYAVLDSKEVKKKQPIGVTRLAQKLVFWRDENNTVHAIYDQCCHRGAALSKGKVVGDHIECPFHGFNYDGNGRVTLIPANGQKAAIAERYKVNALIVKEAYGFIWVWHGEASEELPEVPFFQDLKQGYAYSTFSETWPVHYTRAIENQLDVVHLPFVHETTIGKGGKTLINGPVVKWNENLMTFYVHNEKDHGQKPLKPEEMPEYEKLFKLQLQMPNTWQNYISDKVRVMAAFAPIDEENTHIYLRFYQSFLTVPILRDWVGGLSQFYNRIILHQDRRVVLTQIPKKTELKMGENLIPGDLPIIEFRKKREELKRSS